MQSILRSVTDPHIPTDLARDSYMLDVLDEVRIQYDPYEVAQVFFQRESYLHSLCQVICRVLDAADAPTMNVSSLRDTPTKEDLSDTQKLGETER